MTRTPFQTTLAAVLVAGGLSLAWRQTHFPEPAGKAASALPAAAVASTARPVAAAAPAAPRLPADGLRPEPLRGAVAAVRENIDRGAFPGAALAAGRGERIALETGVGRVSWGGEPVDAETTVYDLASLTKAVATTTAVMLLTEDGRLQLDAPVRRYLPRFAGGNKDRVTIRQLLTHTSGLPAWADIWSRSPRGALLRAVQTPLERAPGERAEYTDIGFVVLWAAAEQAAGEPLPELLERRVWQPLGMERTRFAPGEGCAACAPTLRLADGTAVRGLVHDPIARQLGGTAGNAGLFSTAQDLARFAAMMANRGELSGVRVLRAETVDRFTRRQPGAGERALGWDTRSPESRNPIASGMSDRAFGHLGYTGTSLWVDPATGSWGVLLTNRTYDPRGPNRIGAARRAVYAGVSKAAAAVAE